MTSECNDLLKPFGKTIRDATEHYTKFLKVASKSRLVPEVVADLLVEKSKMSEDYVDDLDNRLGRFAAAFPTALIAAVTKDEAEAWLVSLNVAGTTFDNFRRLLIVLFNFAIEKGYAATNPILKIKKKGSDGDEAPEILTVADTRALLAASDAGTLPFYAIGAFAGLRPSEILRLDWSNVNFAESLIKVVGRKGAKQRGAKIRFVKMQPNLAKWMAPYRGSSGPVIEQTNWRKRDEAARRAAGFGTPGSETKEEKAAGLELKEWPHDGLRHSFASYHLRHFENLNVLILEMGHSGNTMIFNHYRQAVTPREAAQYWKIQPAKAGADGKIVPMAPDPADEMGGGEAILWGIHPEDAKPKDEEGFYAISHKAGKVKVRAVRH
jgi:integrase